MVSKMPFDWQKDLALLTLVVRVPEVLVVHRRQRGRCRTWSPMRAPTRRRSTSARPAPAPSRIWRSSSSRPRPRSTSSTCPIAARPRRERPARRPLEMIVLDTPVLLPHIRAGKVKLLAVTSAARAALPDVPTTGRAASRPCCPTIGTASRRRRRARGVSTSCTRRRPPHCARRAEEAVRQPGRGAGADDARRVRRLREERAGQMGPVVVATGAKLE